MSGNPTYQKLGRVFAISPLLADRTVQILRQFQKNDSVSLVSIKRKARWGGQRRWNIHSIVRVFVDPAKTTAQEGEFVLVEAVELHVNRSRAIASIENER